MRVPGSVATGKRPPFPEGTFAGTLTDVKEAWNDDQNACDLLLTFSENTAVEGPEVGARPKMQRITVVYHDGDSGHASVPLADIEEFTDDTPFRLRDAATLLTQLAVAIGAAAPEENNDVEFDMGQFIESLTGGVFKGETVIYGVRHRYAKTDKKKERPFDNIVSFKSAEEPEEDLPIVTAPEPVPPAPVAKSAAKINLTGGRKR